MAMRDPGLPGRNPFFEHDAGDDPEEHAAAVGGRPWIPDVGGADPLGTLASLVDALQQAQPEATEHLVAAAHEMVLAVKTVVDATEAALAAHRAQLPAADAAPGADAPDAADTPPPSRTTGVRRIDLA
jgi:hypothetical protein